MAPSAAVGHQSMPPAMVNVAGTERFFQGVFIMPLWCLSVTVASGELTIQDHLG